MGNSAGFTQVVTTSYWNRWLCSLKPFNRIAIKYTKVVKYEVKLLIFFTRIVATRLAFVLFVFGENSQRKFCQPGSNNSYWPVVETLLLLYNFVPNYYSAPGRGAEYCDERVCMSVRARAYLHNYAVSQKTRHYYSCHKAITSQMLTDFQNSFADRLSGKFATKSYLNNPLHLKYVATLPCEISMFKKSQCSRSNWANCRVRLSHSKTIFVW